MIASIQFRHFKALRATSLKLEPFNLIIGPNGSGKSSLIQAILRLRNLAQLPLTADPVPVVGALERPELVFRFQEPHEQIEARLICISDLVCDFLRVKSPSTAIWEDLCAELMGARVFLFDHYAMAMPARPEPGAQLMTNGGNLASVLAGLQEADPLAFAEVQTEACRLMPEFGRIGIRNSPGGKVELGMELHEDQEWIAADNLSQGSLYLLALLALSHDPAPPTILCIEDLDRGIHPRLLREVRDILYRLSYPQAYGLKRRPVQVIATTHSPYLLDQFRDHPEEVVVAHKRGRSASFLRLIERPDFEQLLQEGNLGDLWYAGILGGVPEETARDPRVGALKIPD